MEIAAVLAVLLAIAGIIGAVISSQAAERRRAEEQRQLQAAERKRIEECGKVVLFFANHLPYTARQAISRAELEQLIDAGKSPEDLGKEVGRRIQEMDGLVIGYQVIAGHPVEVKLTEEFRDRHIYVVGKSGSGKTTLLRTMAFQDMALGNGIGVIAPEAEMINEELLPFVPEERLDDVIYFNPADSQAPVPFNPLHLDDGEDLDLKVDENLTLLRRIIGEPSPRMDEILRQTLYALIARAGSTLLDVERLLDRTDATVRNQVIGSAEERSRHFWQHVYPTFPKDSHLPITNRLGRFLSAKSIRAMLCSPEASLNFRQAMDEGKILLFNVSDGLLGEQNSQLLGQLIVAKFQLAVMSRAQLPKYRRRKFYLYIDEFQTFTGTAGASYEKILSRARKYGLGLILAHQQSGQIPAGLLKDILGNVSTTVCFQVSREDALRFSREFVTEFDGEILNVPEEEILRLKVGQAWCKVGRHAFFMNTYLPPETSGASSRYAGQIIERSQRNYGRRLAAAGADAGMAAPRPEPLADLDPEKLF